MKSGRNWMKLGTICLVRLETELATAGWNSHGLHVVHVPRAEKEEDDGSRPNAVHISELNSAFV